MDGELKVNKVDKFYDGHQPKKWTGQTHTRPKAKFYMSHFWIGILKWFKLVKLAKKMMLFHL